MIAFYCSVASGAVGFLLGWTIAFREAGRRERARLVDFRTSLYHLMGYDAKPAPAPSLLLGPEAEAAR